MKRRLRQTQQILAIAVASLFATSTTSLAVVEPETLSSSDLAVAIEKLQFLGSVLYVAAHPDDENTSLLAFLSRGQLARTTYLSVTRGDGGQNLIGTELGDLLGLIRTQELLEARHRDGAEQRFTRAIDFGYTKSVDETLQVWGDEALADVVRAIRTLQPDVIVMRFPGDGRGGHGQHTASAVLATEAFDAAADPQRFPEQLRGDGAVAPWQATRLLWDAARFFGGGQTAEDGISVDIGAYSPLLGQSFTEVSAKSRSMHQSQGFGAAGARGASANMLEHRKGERAVNGLFDGVDTSWARVGGEAVGELLAQVATTFEPRTPHLVVPKLLEARSKLQKLGSSVWTRHKIVELDRVLLSACGVWLEATAATPEASEGGTVELRLRAINRSPISVELTAARLPFEVARHELAVPLPNNEAWEQRFSVVVPPKTETTQPYWLESPPDGAVYRVADSTKIGLPESHSLQARVTLVVEGSEIEVPLPLLYRWTDRVEGERYRVFGVVPQIDVKLASAVEVFADDSPKLVTVSVSGAEPETQGEVSLRLPSGWRADPIVVPLVSSSGPSQDVSFAVHPPSDASTGTLVAEVRTSSGGSYSSSKTTIEYRHIPVQTVLRPSEARLVRVELERRGDLVGYVHGAGDAVPEALRQIGYRVALLSDDDLISGDLSGYDAIVLGIRAYNARPVVLENNHRLLAYVEAGGTLIGQYNTVSRRRQGPPITYGPFPFRVSRDRVSVEDAPVSLLLPEHPLLTTPNRITAADFDGWVQERGLYFPNEWDDRYSAPIASHDPGEPDLAGGLLYAEHGKGVYIYTGYSFFRELPAGVPGAYRLFVNMLSARASGTGD